MPDDPSKENNAASEKYYTRPAEDRYAHFHESNTVKEHPKATPGGNRFVCWRCEVPFTVTRNAKKLKLLREGVIKRPLCPSCDTRDNDLAAGVTHCLRVLGGSCQVSDVVGVYSDEKRAKTLFQDPFATLRQKYQGRDALCLQDIEGWIWDGTLRFDEKGHLAKPSESFIKQLKFREQVREIRNEIHEQLKPKPKVESDAGKESGLSRRKEDGGASIGAHYWDAMKEKK